MLDLVIGIPTYRRPDLLQALFESLRPELSGHTVLVVVADNDCDPSIHNIVAAQNSVADHRFIYQPVAERGLSPVRNALVETATANAPGWRYLIMLDDDGKVTPGWLAAMLKCAQTYEPHLLGGPVEGELPSGANVLARNSIYASRKRWATGPVRLLNTTQNLLISSKVIDLVGTTLFQSKYKASGGEDYDLFRRVEAAGGRIVWCNEAVVFEPAPPSRLTVKSVLERYYSTGVYMSKIDADYDGRPAAWKVALKGGAGAGARFVLALASLNKNRVAATVLAMAHYCGRVAGMIGAASARYTKGTVE